MKQEQKQEINHEIEPAGFSAWLNFFKVIFASKSNYSDEKAQKDARYATKIQNTIPTQDIIKQVWEKR